MCEQRLRGEKDKKGRASDSDRVEKKTHGEMRLKSWVTDSLKREMNNRLVSLNLTL